MGNGGKWKSKSKRQSTKLRVKVEKKVKEHARKLKREKKKNPGKFQKSKKDQGVPNECPFKDKVLAEAQEAMEKRNEDLEKRRKELKEMRIYFKADWVFLYFMEKGLCKYFQNTILKIIT